MSSQLVGSDFTGAAQLPNYVNGRLLTAEDLATSQATLQARDGLIGQAAGHGVVTGLSVTSTATTLTVAPGLGIASSGAAVSLGASITLPLTFAAPTAGATASGSFSCCTPTPATGSSAIGPGCYLLTALPAAQLTGQAPLASPPDTSMPSGCTAQWQVQGTQFKAITLNLPDSVLNIAVTDDNRRNLLAQWCFGTPQLAALGADLFNFAAGYGGFDTLDPADLTADDVPLAVFYWDGQAVSFVDNWSARRRITGPDPVAASWSGVVSDRRTADGQARLLQFQNQAAELVASGAAATVAAATTFPLLPPVGFLQVQQVNDLLDQVIRESKSSRAGLPVELQGDIGTLLTATPSQPGFDYKEFFGDSAIYGGLLDWEIADFALRQSWENMPAPTIPRPARTPPPLMYYVVPQNLMMAGTTSGSGPADLYLVFIKNYTWSASSQVPVIIPHRFGFGTIQG
jgi:hypothetical protein